MRDLVTEDLADRQVLELAEHAGQLVAAIVEEGQNRGLLFHYLVAIVLSAADAISAAVDAADVRQAVEDLRERITNKLRGDCEPCKRCRVSPCPDRPTPQLVQMPTRAPSPDILQ